MPKKTENISEPLALYDDLQLVRSRKPIVHNVTNYVVMNTTANILLAVGASPIMAHATEEMEEIARLSQALVLNIGTLDKEWIASMRLAQQMAAQRNIPIVLDPVGAGATKLRTETAKEFLAAGVTVLKGNSSEIIALADGAANVTGVDSNLSTYAAAGAARKLSNLYKCVVVVSGAHDFIAAPDKQGYVPYGSQMMTKVTGTGCAASAVVAAFCAVNENYFLAATHAMGVLGLAAQKAELYANGPASFYASLVDALFSLGQSDIERFWLKNVLSSQNHRAAKTRDEL